MKPKIINDREFKIVGIRKLIKPGTDSFPKLWGEFFSRRNEIRNDVNQGVALGIYEHMPNNAVEGFYYCACVEVSDFENIPEGMIYRTISSKTYAVFTHKGPMHEGKKTYDFIYGTWFPNSAYKAAEGDKIELYDDRSTDYSSPDCEFDIYIPIKHIE